MNLDKLFKLAALDGHGEWDYAVPSDWLMADPEKRRPHVWFYPHHKAGRKPRMFGRPLAWRAVARLALRRMRRAGIPQIDDWIRTWTFTFPGRPLDAAGARALEKAAAAAGLVRAVNLNIVLRHYGLPELELPETPAATAVQAAA